ncbi:MAG: MFS transporter [Dehalococcoidales bacterium]|nr:MAG: MFS transporter [Dehalococcoidales bacterium]
MTSQVKTGKREFFYGYVIVALGLFINMVLGGTLYTFSVFFEPLSTEFGWTRAATAGAFSLYMILHGVLYIFTGKMNDILGPRIVMSLCGLIMGAGYMLMALTGEIWHIYLFYGVIIAVGMSGGYVPLTSTVTRWFTGNSKRGLMVGISVAGVGLGTMIFPPLARWLIDSYGWKTSYIVIGVAVLVIIMSAAQFLKRAPEQIISNLDTSGSIDTQQQGFSLQKAVKTRPFWLITIAYLGFGLVLQAIMVHIVMHITGTGISDSTAASIFIAIGGVSVCARILLGSLADRIGNRSIVIGSFVLMAIAVLWLFIAREMWMFYIFGAIFGFGYGGMVASQSPIVADLFGMRSHGVILGVIVSVITFGAAVGPVMAGAIYDASASYTAAFIVCVIFAVIGIILSLFLKPVPNGGES